MITRCLWPSSTESSRASWYSSIGSLGKAFVPLICVQPEQRRRGVALRLLASAEASCRTPKPFTSTNACNMSALRLFDRAGFVRSGTIENLDVDDPELVHYKRLAVG